MIDKINMCSSCNEFPVVVVENIWKNGEKTWYAKIYCNHACDSQVACDDVDFDIALKNCIREWNNLKY